MMRLQAFILLSITTLSSSVLVLGEPRAGEENVCSYNKVIKKEKLVPEQIKYDIPYTTSCGFLPCTQTRHEYRINMRRVVDQLEVAVVSCCAGHLETPSGSCVPVCNEACRNGVCIRPNVCKCDPAPTEDSAGYAGRTCDRFVCLDENRWGSNCEKPCDCPENSFCHPKTGKCICRTNWRGANCTERCDSGTSNTCDNLIPPVLEPEANLIIGSESARSASLQLESADVEKSASHLHISTPFVLFNILLSIILVSVLVSVIWCKTRNPRQPTQTQAGMKPPPGLESDYCSPDCLIYMPGSSICSSEGTRLSFDPATRPLPHPSDDFAKTNTLGDNDSEIRNKAAINHSVEQRMINLKQASLLNSYSSKGSVVYDSASGAMTKQDQFRDTMNSTLDSSLDESVNNVPQYDETAKNIYDEIDNSKRKLIDTDHTQ